MITPYSKPICLALMAALAGSLFLCGFFALDFIHSYRLSKLGAQLFVLTSAVSAPAGLVLTIAEWRRPHRALAWPLTLLAVSTVPLLLLMALFWNDPD